MKTPAKPVDPAHAHPWLLVLMNREAAALMRTAADGDSGVWGRVRELLGREPTHEERSAIVRWFVERTTSFSNRAHRALRRAEGGSR